MGYRLDLTDELPRSLRRTVAEQLDGAIDQLRDGHADDPVDAVHDVRKRLKKSRSALRLARPGMRGRDFKRENRALRDRGRALAGARDADVMVATIDKLLERFAGHEPEALFAHVRERLAGRAEHMRGEVGKTIPEQADALRALHGRADGWSLERVDAKALIGGVARAYSLGRAGFAAADRKPTAANLHEWRKRVKDLWYQLRLLRDAWPGVMKAVADEAKALSKVLGDDHDLAVLGELLAGDRKLTADAAADVDKVLELIEQRRAELLEEARKLGKRIYAETPKAFRKRLKRYVRSLAAGIPIAA
jgi:CHAD domain-containing protein